ncbi:SLC13 family permease [Loktanella sp. DJP18]|uniref:SLC13 family permease n=1 Tax=Loktanella sp. DJP18 TaxID=3409788 RepID=UPI003BB78142
MRREVTALPRMTGSQWTSTIAALAAVATVIATRDPALRVVAVSGAGIVAFATRSLPEAATALFIFLGFLAIDAAPQSVVFSGFASSGFWLLVGGLVIGSAITASGLGDQIARLIFACTGTSYARAVLFLSVGGLALGAFVPSAIPRVIVMMPITQALAHRMMLPAGSRSRTGLLMTAAMMTLVPTYAFLTANLPTIVEVGIIEILYGVQFGYGSYFVQNLPINALRFAVLLVLLLDYGRGQTVAPSPKSGDDAPARWTTGQRRLSVVLAVAVVLWATDSLHGIAPAWITVAAALVLLLPTSKVFAPQAMKTEIDLSIAFLIAAVLCISAVITHISLGQRIAEVVVPALQLAPGSGFWNLSAITLFTSALSHLTIAPATPVVVAPLAQAMSDATGWSVTAVAMAQNIGMSTIALPYQSPPLLIGIAIAAIPVGPLTRLCLVSAVITTALGLPLTWVWWTWLTLIP